jgi:ATP-dependent DNA helicase PIF1
MNKRKLDELLEKAQAEVESKKSKFFKPYKPVAKPKAKTETKKKSSLAVPTQAQEEVKLSLMQLKVVATVKDKKNIFFSGVAGSGKSFLLDYLIKYVLPEQSTFVTASTGLAAVPISGTTLHSFAGIGLGIESKEALAEKVLGSKPAKQKWKDARVLVIDEISMISATLFDKIEYVARMARGNSKPFGGVQVIMCGDFLQLPPVEKIAGITHFCFEAESWGKVIQDIIILDKVYRQNSDVLVDALNEIRYGIVTDKTKELFKPCIGREFDTSDGIQATVLYPTKKEVSHINDEKLTALPGKATPFKWIESGNQRYLETLKKNCNAVENLELKIGAQVMLVKNLDTSRGLVNGSRGVVTDFETEGEDDDTLYPLVRFVNGSSLLLIREKWETKVQGKVVARIQQIPLILAWSLTMHKCQGMTLDRAEISMEFIFEFAQAYVALSRVRSLDGLRLLSFNSEVIRAHPRAKEFYIRKEPAVPLTSLKEPAVPLTSLRDSTLP